MRIIKKKKIANPEAVVSIPALITGSFFFTGFFPVASGTIGSLAALGVLFISQALNPLNLLILIVLFFIAGTAASKQIMIRYGDDPSVIVVDEVVGMWITLLIFIIFGRSEMSLFYAAVSFLSFRFFDIFKFQPARYFDELKSAFGVMMDDVVAGVYAGIFCVILSLTGFNPF